jgi:hypothetical protein
VLNLSGTRVGNTGAEAVARALRHNTHLKELYLSNTTVDDKGAAALAAALTLNRGLERLHISKWVGRVRGRGRAAVRFWRGQLAADAVAAGVCDAHD